MDWDKLWKMTEEYVSCMTDAAYQRGIADTRKQELEEYLDACKEEASKPAPSPAPAKEERRNKDGVRLVCGNCKFIGVDWVKKQNICQKRNFVTDQERPCCNLFDPSLAALAAASNDAVCAAVEKKAEAEGVFGPLTPKSVRCADCKHGEVTVNEGTVTCKKSGVVFEDYSKYMPCDEFEPKEEP